MIVIVLGLHDVARESIFCRRGQLLDSAWWFGRRVPFVLGDMPVWRRTMMVTGTSWVHGLVVFSL